MVIFLKNLDKAKVVTFQARERVKKFQGYGCIKRKYILFYIEFLTRHLVKKKDSCGMLLIEHYTYFNSLS